jgi:hypothetical protein
MGDSFRATAARGYGATADASAMSPDIIYPIVGESALS